MKDPVVVLLACLVIIVVVVSALYTLELRNECREKGGYYVQEVGKVGYSCILPK